MNKKVLFTAGALGLGASSALANPGPALPMPFAGSDTLHQISIDVVNACGLTGSIRSTGGGSSLGGTRMDPRTTFAPHGQQQIAPQSRFLSANECNFFNGVSPYPGEAALGPNAGQGLVIGLDGLAVFRDKTEGSSCRVLRYAGCMEVQDLNNNAVLGYGLGGAGIDDGTGNVANSVSTLALVDGPDGDGVADHYCFTHWADALRIIYTGQHAHINDSSDSTTAACNPNAPSASNINQRRCNSDVRWTLVSNWSNIFDSAGDDGAGGCADGNCTAGLKHAWRRDDFSGTTDAFLSLIGAPGLGSSFNVRTFCNGLENEDLDPIRRRCDPDATNSNNDRESVCGPTPFRYRNQPFDATTGNPSGATTGTAAVASPEPAASAAGDLGLVLAISLPQATVTDPANPGNPLVDPATGLLYNPQFDDNIFCSSSSINTPVKLAPMQSALSTNMQRCPNGNARVANRCYWPVRQNNLSGQSPLKNGWFNCKARRNNRPAGSAWANFDARAYNRVPRHPITGDILQPAYIPPGSTTPVVSDPRFAGGGDSRIHMTFPKTTLPNHPSCRLVDATLQIGCLVQADPCSVGYAGLGGEDTSATVPGTNEALVLRAPYDANTAETNVGDDTEVTASVATVQELLQPAGANCRAAGTYATRYPISRKLWVTAAKGFGDSFPFNPANPAPRIKNVVDVDPDFTQVDPTVVNGPLTPDGVINASDVTTNENQLIQCFANRTMVDPIVLAREFIQLPAGYPEASRLQSCP